MTTNLGSSEDRTTYSQPSALLVEHRNTAQLAAVPFCFVLVEFGVDRLEEGSHEGDLERRTHDGALEPEVLD